MMRVAINQSNYLPWKGYFDLIHDVDLFVFYDDVQYTVRDWRNRNRFKTAHGTRWLTVPVGDNRNRLIQDVAIVEHEWQRLHWDTVRHAYARAPYFDRVADYLREVYLKRTWTNLSELNQQLTLNIARNWLGIRTEFVKSSQLPGEGQKQDRIFSLLKAVGAKVYVSGPAAKDYLEPERFERERVELVWKDYSGYPEYEQLHPPFEHAVSIVDLLMHTGADAPRYIWGWRSGSAARA
jgi:hypothetical protein